MPAALARRQNVLRERVRAGSTVIMTTHILEVAERMADRIGVIASGRLIAEGTLDELRRQAGNGDSSLEEIFLALVAQDSRRHEPTRQPRLVRPPRTAARLARLARA